MAILSSKALETVKMWLKQHSDVVQAVQQNGNQGNEAIVHEYIKLIKDGNFSLKEATSLFKEIAILYEGSKAKGFVAGLALALLSLTGASASSQFSSSGHGSGFATNANEIQNYQSLVGTILVLPQQGVAKEFQINDAATAQKVFNFLSKNKDAKDFGVVISQKAIENTGAISGGSEQTLNNYGGF